MLQLEHIFKTYYVGDETVHALDDASLPRPTRIVLLSPMIGITSLARFAGVLGWPAHMVMTSPWLTATQTASAP